MKKILSISSQLYSTATAIFFSTISLVHAIALKDLSEDYKYLPEIQNLYEMGVINGYPDGTFRPEGDLNRAELLKIVMLSAQIEPVGLLKDCFNDVKDEWFAEYVCMAKERGWVQGYADGTFKPGQIVNRVEALKMLLEVYNVELIAPGYQRFVDIDLAAWYAKYIVTAESWQILELASSDVHYKPADAMKRGVFSYYADSMLKEEASRFQSAFDAWICEAYAKQGYDIQKTPFDEVEPLLDAELIKRGFKVDELQYKEELGRRNPVNLKLADILTGVFDAQSYCK
jgi:hypothetical protein